MMLVNGKICQAQQREFQILNSCPEQCECYSDSQDIEDRITHEKLNHYKLEPVTLNTLCYLIQAKHVITSLHCSVRHRHACSYRLSSDLKSKDGSLWATCLTRTTGSMPMDIAKNHAHFWDILMASHSYQLSMQFCTTCRRLVFLTNVATSNWACAKFEHVPN